MESCETRLKGVTPILRMFDEEKTKAFYVDFLDFSVDWEHRFEDNSPLYMQVSRGGCILHLSEHHGDGSPNTIIRIEVGNIKAFHANLLEKKYKYVRPGLERMPWGSTELTVIDPSGNRLVFYENRTA